MPFWLLTNCTWSMNRSPPSARMPAPLKSGTRARVSVRLRIVMLLPRVMNSALPSQDLSVITVASCPAPSIVRLLARQRAQSK
jgi:hypothetical protein